MHSVCTAKKEIRNIDRTTQIGYAASESKRCMVRILVIPKIPRLHKVFRTSTLDVLMVYVVWCSTEEGKKAVQWGLLPTVRKDWLKYIRIWFRFECDTPVILTEGLVSKRAKRVTGHDDIDQSTPKVKVLYALLVEVFTRSWNHQKARIRKCTA